MSSLAGNQIARETLDLDILFVGAGPSGLAGAYHLARLIRDHNAAHPTKPIEASIAVLEKGKEVGSHLLSGAVVDPRGLAELFPDDWHSAPFEARVGRDALLFLTAGGKLSLPVPPPLSNHGKYVASIGKLCKWMAAKVQEIGVDLFTEFPGASALLENGRMAGVRTADRGLDHHGKPKANFEPGIDIRTRCTVLCEGVRGSLAKELDAAFQLSAGKNPQLYALGIKEMWEVPAGRIAPGEVIHTMGWPLGMHTFGGGFLYGLQDNHLVLGLVVGLDYENPLLDPHAEFQRLKTHPWLRGLLAGGTMVNYGAKALPEGGLWSMPRLAGDGFLLCGDSGGFLNSQKLKGIHLAIKSGMLAAETIFEGLAGGSTAGGSLDAAALARYETKVRQSWAHDELWKVRNFHQAFDHGLLAGMFQAGAGLVTGGRGWGFKNRLSSTPGHTRMRKLTPGASRAVRGIEPDGTLTFDRASDVYNSGTSHDENQPVHLLVADTSVCVTRCAEEFANPCQRFCPAGVYEMVQDAKEPAGRRLQINASNCVHCKTCDILDPYELITWVPPEGGGGPSYGRM